MGADGGRLALRVDAVQAQGGGDFLGEEFEAIQPTISPRSFARARPASLLAGSILMVILSSLITEVAALRQ